MEIFDFFFYYWEGKVAFVLTWWNSFIQMSWGNGGSGPSNTGLLPQGQRFHFISERQVEKENPGCLHCYCSCLEPSFCNTKPHWGGGVGRMRNGSGLHTTGKNHSLRLGPGERLVQSSWLYMPGEFCQAVLGSSGQVMAQMIQTLTVLTGTQQVFLNKCFSICCIPLEQLQDTIIVFSPYFHQLGLLIWGEGLQISLCHHSGNAIPVHIHFVVPIIS